MAHNLDDDEILSIVEGEINGSSDYMDSEISSQREKGNGVLLRGAFLETKKKVALRLL